MIFVIGAFDDVNGHTSFFQLFQVLLAIVCAKNMRRSARHADLSPRVASTPRIVRGAAAPVRNQKWAGLGRGSST